MNRILTGLAFMQERASNVFEFTGEGRAQLARAYQRLGSAAHEAQALLEAEPLHAPGKQHLTSEALLADAVLILFAAANNNQLNLASAVLKRLQHAEDVMASKHAPSKDL